jgi:Fe2+ or Zn2+ uptake regulation protein
MNDYYNTNKETGETLQESNLKARNQQEEMLDVFRKFHYMTFTARRIWRECFNEKIPFSSVHRCLRNLEKSGRIIKTGQMLKSSYGKQVHTWKYETFID